MTHSGKAVTALPGDTQILVTREFDAPKHLVYRAWTEPDLVARWWAGDHGKVTSITSDLRVGGAWRWAMDANAGFEVAFRGVYREIVPGERIVRTEIFEGMPDAEAVTTVTFTEKDGRTTVEMLTEHTSQANRDMHAQNMEDGMQEALDDLAEVLSTLS
jgi:uncharacterized protein YndB with AHSA1/START domain